MADLAKTGEIIVAERGANHRWGCSYRPSQAKGGVGARRREGRAAARRAVRSDRQQENDRLQVVRGWSLGHPHTGLGVNIGAVSAVIAEGLQQRLVPLVHVDHFAFGIERETHRRLLVAGGSTATLLSKITCAVGLSFCTFTFIGTGCPVVACKCETLTVYSPATMPRTVTISSRIGDAIFLPPTTMNRSRSSGWLSGRHHYHQGKQIRYAATNLLVRTGREFTKPSMNVEQIAAALMVDYRKLVVSFRLA
jgi:hypothetical protein